MNNKEPNRESTTFFSVSFRTLSVVVSSIPAAGFISCVVLSLLYNFKEATYTHCRVANYLPSISASIGGFIPQRYIWRCCIASMIWTLYLTNYTIYKYFAENFAVYQQKLYHALLKISTLLAFVEFTGLAGLTYVSSTENYSIHENCFKVFIACALIHMLLHLILLKVYICKRNTFIFNASIFALAVYLFIRHNTYCEPGIYSLFALCEYLVVLSNIYSHAIEPWYLFGDGELAVCFPKSRRS